MTIAKCKKCRDAIITTENLKDQKYTLCFNCLMEYFKPSKVDGYFLCRKCGIAVSPTLVELNEHTQKHRKIK